MRITVIEDNEALANAIAYRLRDRGHAVDVILNGQQALDFLDAESADLIILDLTLPGLGGLDVLRALRRRGRHTPVLILTALGSTEDRVEGLDAGADDYLVKPFMMDELEARLRALSRRRALEYSAEESIGPLRFDVTSRRLFADGVQLELPRRELATFECLVEHRGKLVSKAQLADHLYGVGASVEDKVVETHVSRLRKRLHEHGVHIKSARGLGYTLVVND